MEVRIDLTTIPSAAAGAYVQVATLPDGISKPVPVGRGMGVTANIPVMVYATAAGAISFLNSSGAARTAIAGDIVYLAG